MGLKILAPFGPGKPYGFQRPNCLKFLNWSKESNILFPVLGEQDYQGQPTLQIETKSHEKSPPRDQSGTSLLSLIRRQAQALLKSHPHP